MATSESGRRSNDQARRDNLLALERYLAEAPCIPEHPTRKGEINYSAIAVGAGVRRPWLYDAAPNAMIRDAAAAKGLGVPQQQRTDSSDPALARATQRIKALEEQLAVSKAESRDLRERLRRYELLERHMTEGGRLPR